jgi:hypothetical protein
MVFENRLLRKRRGVTGDWREMHNEKLHNLSSSSNMMWVGHVVRIEGYQMYAYILI